MMKIELFIHIAAIILGALSTGIPIALKLSKTIKAKRSALEATENAKSEAGEEKAFNEMLSYSFDLIRVAEDAYKGIDKVMKSQGGSAGGMKKKSVLSDLQTFALSNGIKFDSSFWSKKIDEIIDFTKTVNAK